MQRMVVDIIEQAKQAQDAAIEEMLFAFIAQGIVVELCYQTSTQNYELRQPKTGKVLAIIPPVKLCFGGK